LFAAVVLLSIVPLWIGRYLPLIDLPQHAAQVGALREIWSGNEAMAATFRVNWFTPYLLGDLLLYALALVMPVAIATQLLVSVAVVLIPLFTGRLLRAAGADERWKWLAIPCSFSYAFYWGFLAFIIAAPLALLFLIRTIGFVKQPSLQNGVRIALFGVLLFFCHIIVLGFASLIALGYILGTHYRNLKALVRCALPYTAPLPLILTWLAIASEEESVAQNDVITFGPLSYRLTNLLTQPAGREDLTGGSALIVVAVTTATLALPELSGARFSRRPERWLPFLLGALVFLGAPDHIFGTAFFYHRLGVFLVPLWLMAWDVPRRRRPIERLAIPLVVLWAMTNTIRFAAFSRETESFTALMSDMEAGRRVASIMHDPYSPVFGLPVYLHFPAWYQGERGGIVDFSFADTHPSVARYQPGGGRRMRGTLVGNPEGFSWELDGGPSYDYFVIKSTADLSATIFKDRVSSVELVTRRGEWWLYRNVQRSRAERPGATNAG
jgi:hypothetical protein